MDKVPRTHVIGIRVNDDMFNRITIRAIRNLKSVSDYCYNLIANDIYRTKDNKPLDNDSSAPSEDSNGKQV